MGLITRTASTATSPFGGGSAWNSFNTDGGSAFLSTSVSGGSSSTLHRGCQWSNFGAAISGIIQIRMKYDWNWGASASGDVADTGFVNASSSAVGGDFFGSAGISLTGPGPVSDNDDQGNSGSANVVLPNNTTLSSLATDSDLDVTANCGTDGQGSCSSNAQISSLRVEITVSNPQMVSMM